MGGARGVGNSGLSTRRAAKRQAKPVGKFELSTPLSAGGAKAPGSRAAAAQSLDFQANQTAISGLTTKTQKSTKSMITPPSRPVERKCHGRRHGQDPSWWPRVLRVDHQVLQGAAQSAAVHTYSVMHGWRFHP